MKGARQSPQISLKVPNDLKEELIKKAEANFRSLNGEILARLVESLEREGKNERQEGK